MKARQERRPNWGDTHGCSEGAAQPEMNQRLRPVIELKWYGWTVKCKGGEDLRIEFCPWCGNKLKR